MTCDEVRLLAPDAALDLLDAEQRADVLAHVAGCSRCRAELAELAGAADSLLVLAPVAEPPAGFEQRVLTRLDAERTPARRRAARRWFVPAAGAVAAAAVGLVAGFALRGGGDGPDPGVFAARLRNAEGVAVGQVLVSDGPDRMVCVLDRSPAGERYAVSVRGDDGVADIGTFVSAGPGMPWATSLPIEATDVRRVVIRDASGTVRATADLPE